MFLHNNKSISSPGVHEGIFLCRKNSVGLKYKGNQKSCSSEFQVFSRKLLHPFSGCFHLCNIFLCSKITHTSSEESTALTLGWLSGLQHSGHLQPCSGLPCELWFLSGSSSSEKYNCFSLLSSGFGVTSSSSFSRVLLYLKGWVLWITLLWKVHETAVWILLLIAQRQVVQHKNRICIVNLLVKIQNLERLEWNKLIK